MVSPDWLVARATPPKMRLGEPGSIGSGSIDGGWCMKTEGELMKEATAIMIVGVVICPALGFLCMGAWLLVRVVNP